MFNNKIKCIIIINGIGECGKDTLIKFISKKYKVRNESSIDPIKHIALQIGWDGVKNKKSRKFLSDLKKLTIEYNDFPTNYMLSKYKEFLESDEEIMFVHIREPIEIAKLKSKIDRCITLLITNKNAPKLLENDSDDNVDKYNYDYIYHNNYSLLKTEIKFIDFFDNIIKDYERKRVEE